jgi:uncharacterized protein
VPGDPVRIETTKWGDRPHWVFAGVFLGADGHGSWVGFRAGTRFARPAAEFVADHDHVTLVPAEGRFLATFWPGGGRVEVYVDITDRPRWDGPVVRAVDLDLDVVRWPDGRVEVDDEDEFAEHRVVFGYPVEVAAAAEASCAAVVAAVRRAAAPFDAETPASWLAVLRSL